MNREPVDAYGEVFLRLPFFAVLRAWAPEAKVTIIPGIGGASFWEDSIWPITGVLVDEVNRKAIPNPAQGKFDWVFDLEGDARTSFRLRPLASEKFYTTAWRGWLNFPHLPKYHGKHITNRYLGALRHAVGGELPSERPFPFPDAYRAAVDLLLPPGRKYVGISPGAGRQDTGKCWPVERYVELAMRFAQEKWVPVLFLSVAESDWEGHFSGVSDVRFILTENREDVTGVPSDPVLTAAVGERLSAGVGNCNGTGHMLAFGGCPMVTLFGPSNPIKFRPYARDSIQLIPTPPESRDIKTISVEAVLDALRELTNRNAPLRP